MGKSVTKKLLFVSIYIIFITLFDVYSYGVVYQQKIQKENYKSAVWEWIFKESVIPVKGGNHSTVHIEVPRYRFIQKTLEIGGIILILFFCGLPAAIGLAASHYLLTYDFLYYFFLNQLHTLTSLDNTFTPYWLMNWYQSGYLLLQPFNHINFIVSGALGILAALMGCIVQIPVLKRKKEFIFK